MPSCPSPLIPRRGRFFVSSDDAPGAAAVAVMSYAAWQARFGAAPDIVGRTLRINNVSLVVIGVAPPAFLGLNAIFGPELWIPASLSEQLLPIEMRNGLERREKAVFQGVGRLKPGVGRAQAQARLATIAAGLARAYPATNQGQTALVRPISDVLFGSSAGGTSTVVFAGVVLLLVVGVVLLIACSNVANLLLARSVAREHEIAVRLAIGAGRGRLIRQLLTESMLFGLFSGALGLLIGTAGVRLLFSSLPGAANFIAPKLDAVVFAYALAVSLATGFLFGIVPALRTSRIGVGPALNSESRTIGANRGRVTFANILLAGQVAFSFLLLVMAGLFLRSIGRAYQIDPGFDAEHLAIFMTNPGQVGYTKPRTQAFYRDVRSRVGALPGVGSVSWASNLPLWARFESGIQVEGRAQRSQSDVLASIVNIVDLGYFETAGVGIQQGRPFQTIDREDSAPVAIVNAKMAADYWPGQSALGKRVRLPAEKFLRQIVGVARTANYTTLAEPPQDCIYVPLDQAYSDEMTLYVRAKGDPRFLMSAVQREVRAAGPEIFVNDMRTGRALIDGALFQARMGVALLTVFGMLALALAAIGLYGMIAYSVNLRTREIGVRMALGAARGGVLRLILKQGMSLVAAGVAVGFAASLIAGRLLGRLLYGVGAADPASVAGAAFVLLAVAFIACYLPARSASRLDPLAALRQS